MAKTISEIMTSNLVALRRDASITDAAKRMRDEAIGDVIVLDDSDQMCGIVTDRDITVRAVAEGRTDARLGDICSADLTTASPDDDIEDVVRRMRQSDVRRIPVVENGKPVGIVSLGDLAVERDPNSVLGDISAASPNAST